MYREKSLIYRKALILVQIIYEKLTRKFMKIFYTVGYCAIIFKLSLNHIQFLHLYNIRLNL